MTFRVKNPYKTPIDLLKMDFYAAARRTIILFPLKADEVKINNYLLNNYKITLKTLCLKILNNLQISNNSSGDLLIKIKNPDLDKLARLITYGNSELFGSKILKKAFII